MVDNTETKGFVEWYRKNIDRPVTIGVAILGIGALLFPASVAIGQSLMGLTYFNVAYDMTVNKELAAGEQKLRKKVKGFFGR